ncbi:unnamed protein product [Penicillium salamii]|nr:unnamed protein product [Penicillium salamii]
MDSTGTHLLQRPESVLPDDPEFSFTKPASSRRPFSLRNISKQPSTDSSSLGYPPVSDQPANKQVVINPPWIRPDTYVSPRSMLTARTIAYDRFSSTASNCPSPARQPLLAKPARRVSTISDAANVISGQYSSGDGEKSTVEPEHHVAAFQVNEPAEDGRLEEDSEALSDIETAVPKESTLPKPSERTPFPRAAVPTKEPRAQRGHQDSTSLPFSRAPFRPVNVPRSSRKAELAEKEAPAKKQIPIITGKISGQLSENDLFKQLIMKIREREESEQNAASLVRQIESDNRALREKGQNLQERVKKQQLQLVKASTEAKGQRAQIDQWKGKLNNFKGVIQELGREYDKVRQQTMNLKETASSLDNEKILIQTTLSDLKMQISRHTETIEGQKEKLAISDGVIAHLKEALDHSEKRGDLLKTQLVGEKKRTMALETYIQNESQIQARHLNFVKKEQSRMTEKLDSMCDQFTKASLETQDVILSKVGPGVERCVVSVEEMKSQCSAGTINAERFVTSVQETACRFESLSGQFTSVLDRSNEMSNSVFQGLKEGLQSVEKNFGPYSPLVKQLANNENCYNSLQQQVQAVEPTLGNLGVSIKAVEATEASLICALQSFGQMLSAARIPAGNPVLEKELNAKFAENTQLQLRLQQISSEIDSLRMQVSSKTSENIQLQQTLTESMSRFETEIKAFQTANIQTRQMADELESQLEIRTQSEHLKEEAKKEAEKALLLVELEATKRSEEFLTMKQTLSSLECRSAALEKTGAEANAEIVSLLQRAQEAESWQVMIREGVTKVMEVQPGEPFEAIWQKVEHALSERLCHGSEDVNTDVQLPSNACNVSHSLEHDDCVDPRHVLPTNHGHIVPFSILHEKIAPEDDDVSLFNDTAELEMLMMSTPDLQGPFAPKQKALCDDASKETHKASEISDKGSNFAKEVDSVIDSAIIEQSRHTPGNPPGLIADNGAKLEQVDTRRKMVSFEGTHVFARTEVGRPRRLSDATDNSSGIESESKETKRTQKRTYSRLRQSVAQEETSTETNAGLQSIENDVVGNPQQDPKKMAEDPDAPRKPAKRSRKTCDEPERRLTPRGLASGSSRSNPVSLATNARARAKRRSRGR